MNDVFVILITSYVIISEVVATINSIKMLHLLKNKCKKQYPIMYFDELQTRVIMFATLIWLPCIILQSFYNTMKK